MVPNNLAKVPQLTIAKQNPSLGLRMDKISDPRRINAFNIVAIYGNPTHGKSSLAQALSKQEGFLYLSTDTIFFSDVAPNIPNRDSFIARKNEPTKQFNVGAYIDSDLYDHNLFVACLTQALKSKLRLNPGTHIVLLDGYVLKHYARIFKELGISPERTLVLHASVINQRYIIGGFDVTGYYYDKVLEHIRASFFKQCVSTTLPKSRYQSFTPLKLAEATNANTASDTLSKYSASHLDAVIQESHRFVDIGCNAGYFCFQVANKTNGSIVGVDIVRSWVEIASHINNSIFLKKNISFFNSEALEFLSENPRSFEVIHCASTYHYFRECQVAFLGAARGALVPNGLLVLEVELANEEGRPQMVKRSRGVDSVPCAFPNRAMFLQQIAALFTVEAEFKSVFQRGSFYERTYFHLRPRQPKVRYALDIANGNKISGWAMYTSKPHQPVKLLIRVNHSKDFIVPAHLYREDLLTKSIHPTGKCGFMVMLSEKDFLIPGDNVSLITIDTNTENGNEEKISLGELLTTIRVH